MGVKISEAATIVGVHPNTLKNLESRGVIHPGRDCNGRRLYRAEDIEAIRRHYATEKGHGVE